MDDLYRRLRARIERTSTGARHPPLSPVSGHSTRAGERTGLTLENRQTVDEVVGGTELTNEAGVTYLSELGLPLHHLHGRCALERYLELQQHWPFTPDPFGIPAAPDGQPPDLSSAAFFDTETTGLAGGTGTYIILAGLGYFQADRFVVRQFLLRDYDEEAALLTALYSELQQRTALITFNGSSFDLPLVGTRFTLCGAEPPPVVDVHWDLLHSARRVYGWQLDSCALSALEKHVLGFVRPTDVPGAEIPARYFAYLQAQDASHLEGICEHNRDDLLSLVVLAATLMELAVNPGAHNTSGHDLLGLARSYELEGELRRAAAFYREGLRQLEEYQQETGETPRLRLARVLKRLRRYDAAAVQWERLIADGSKLLEPAVELAKHYEHRLEAFSRALEVVDQALELVNLSVRERERLLHRRQRLVHRLRQRSVSCPWTSTE